MSLRVGRLFLSITEAAAACRTFSSSAASDALLKLQGEVIVIPLPQLSPNMSSGKILKWMKHPGDAIDTYDVMFECSTSTLSESAYKVGDFAGEVSLLVEAHDDGVLAKVLVPEGREVAVHTPVALMCEEAGDVPALSRLDDSFWTSQQIQSLKVITWQAFLKERSAGGRGCD